MVSFRGTISDENSRIDLQFGQIPALDICDDCLAHQGFWTATGNASTHVTPLVEAAAAQHRDYRIVVTGHSLGGALATLEATILRNRGLNADLVRIRVLVNRLLVVF